MPKSTKIFYFCLSFIVGIAIASFIFIYWLVLILSFVSLLFFISFFKLKNKKSIILIIFFLFFGVFYYQFFSYFKNIEIETKKVSQFKVVVVDEPDQRLENVKLKVKSLDFKTNILITTEIFPKYNYGDVLNIECELQRPENFNGFAYDKYLERYNIYYVCYYPKIKLLEKNQGSFLFKNILKIKNIFINKINQIFPEPQASFLAGLLIGAKKSISPELLEAFNRTGVTHIIAISGFNITIIIVLISNLTKHFYLGRKKSFWFIFFIIILFVVLTGASASIVRAGIMGLLVLLAKREGRLSQTKNILILSAVLMLIFNPKILVFDVGFQLSFLATIGLIYVSPVLAKYFQWIPKKIGLRENFLATLSATLITLPLILFQFGRLSTVAILTNLLILQVIPWAMLFGFLSIVVGFIFLSLGKVFGILTFIILTYIINVVCFFSKWQFAVYEIKFNLWLFLVSYFIMFLFLIKRLNLLKLLTNRKK